MSGIFEDLMSEISVAYMHEYMHEKILYMYSNFHKGGPLFS